MNAHATTASSAPEQESNVSKHVSDSKVEVEEPEEEGFKKRRNVKKAIPLKWLKLPTVCQTLTGAASCIFPLTTAQPTWKSMASNYQSERW
jgi:hypothetical protein